MITARPTPSRAPSAFPRSSSRHEHTHTQQARTANDGHANDGERPSVDDWRRRRRLRGIRLRRTQRRRALAFDCPVHTHTLSTMRPLSLSLSPLLAGIPAVGLGAHRQRSDAGRRASDESETPKSLSVSVSGLSEGARVRWAVGQSVDFKRPRLSKSENTQHKTSHPHSTKRSLDCRRHLSPPLPLAVSLRQSLSDLVQLRRGRGHHERELLAAGHASGRGLAVKVGAKARDGAVGAEGERVHGAS